MKALISTKYLTKKLEEILNNGPILYCILNGNQLIFRPTSGKKDQEIIIDIHLIEKSNSYGYFIFNKNQWFQLFDLLKKLTEQPIVIEIKELNRIHKISLSQFTITF